MNTLLVETKNATSTREKIISILAADWPLTGKEIYNKLSKENGFTATYQAVHKTVSQMAETRVLSKIGSQYQLDKDWIENLHQFSKNLKTAYIENGKRPELNQELNGTTKWIFDNYSEMCVELAKLFASRKLVGNNKSEGIGVMRHCPWTLEFKFIDFNLVRDMMKNNSGGYMISQENTPFDRWVKKQFLAAGGNGVLLGQTNLNLKKDLIIHGEYILEIQYSEKMKKDLDEIYSKIENLGDLFKLYVGNSVPQDQGKIEVTFTRNPTLAALMRSQFVEKYFGEEK